MLQDIPTIPQRIYKLRGELKTNIVRTEADTSSGRLLCRVFFQNKDGVKDYTYAPDDVIELPYRGTDEGHFRFIDQKGRLSFAIRVHYFGNGDAICAETKRGYLSYGFKKGLQLEEFATASQQQTQNGTNVNCLAIAARATGGINILPMLEAHAGPVIGYGNIFPFTESGNPTTFCG